MPYAGCRNRGSSDDEHRRGNAAAAQPVVELSEQIGDLLGAELVPLRAGTHAVTRSRSGT